MAAISFMPQMVSAVRAKSIQRIPRKAAKPPRRRLHTLLNNQPSREDRMIERLEQRRLLAFSVTDGVLTVTGTENPDQILVRRDGTDLTISENGVRATTPAADVTAIVVDGGAGNDR